tara:strand:+ start:1374 stop:1538 length:165 start_codon:yes stop_codon:yes gene_type:complete
VNNKSDRKKPQQSKSLKTPQEQPLPIWRYFVLAFIEGATVIAVELFGAKMMTPY